MSLLSIIVALIAVGILLWVVNTLIPLDPKIRQILNIVVVLVVILWLLRAFGVWSALGAVRP